MKIRHVRRDNPGKSKNQTESNSGSGGQEVAPPPYGLEFMDNQEHPLQLSEDTKASGSPTDQAINQTSLPDDLKAGVENLSGYSLDDVNVHYNSDKPAQIQAHAYAQGTDIHLAPGQERHLPHETWHVVQQKQGRVQPTRQLGGKVNINDEVGLEKEADVMGNKAMRKQTPKTDNLTWEQSILSNALPIQPVLMDNGLAVWIEEDLANIPESLAAVKSAVEAYKKDDQNAKLRTKLEKALNTLAASLIEEEVINKVFNSLKNVIPNLEREHVLLQATYNFNGPITLSLENVLAWLRIAGGDFTIDDIRYVRHELVELRALQDNKAKPAHIKGPDAPLREEEFDEFFEEDNGFNNQYNDAHKAALDEEVGFLTNALNHAYPDLKATKKQVAHSHVSRTGEFLAKFPTKKADGDLYGDDDRVKIEILEDYDEAVKRALETLSMDHFELPNNKEIFSIENLPQWTVETELDIGKVVNPSV